MVPPTAVALPPGTRGIRRGLPQRGYAGPLRCGASGFADALSGFPFAQVRSVAGEPHVVVEAMTAPPDALSRDVFPLATSGRPYRAARRLSVEEFACEGAPARRVIVDRPPRRSRLALATLLLRRRGAPKIAGIELSAPQDEL